MCVYYNHIYSNNCLWVSGLNNYNKLHNQMDQDQPQNHTQQKKITNYILKQTIGQGAFGKVKLAIHIPTNEKVAIKILQKSRIVDLADVQRVSRELHLLKLLRHPNVIQLYEIIETPKHLFLVMEYVDKGQLFSYIVEKNRLSEIEACKYFRQIISGVAYLHRLNIAHRDLKPENLLLDWNNNIKIADLGLSNTYKNGEQLKTACGSPCYAAPEMIANKPYNGLRTDIWSCGVILYTMVCGCLPFEGEKGENSELYKKIFAGNYHLPEHVTEQFQNLLQNILCVDPDKRFTIDQILNHRWTEFSGPTRIPQGLIVGYHKVTIEQKVIQKIKEYGLDPERTMKCLDANEHNHLTTTYFLLLKKMLKQGRQSHADLSSQTFDYSTIRRQERREKSKTNYPKSFKKIFGESQQDNQARKKSNKKNHQRRLEDLNLADIGLTNQNHTSLDKNKQSQDNFDRRITIFKIRKQGTHSTCKNINKDQISDRKRRLKTQIQDTKRKNRKNFYSVNHYQSTSYKLHGSEGIRIFNSESTQPLKNHKKSKSKSKPSKSKPKPRTSSPTILHTKSNKSEPKIQPTKGYYHYHRHA